MAQLQGDVIPACNSGTVTPPVEQPSIARHTTILLPGFRKAPPWVWFTSIAEVEMKPETIWCGIPGPLTLQPIQRVTTWIRERTLSWTTPVWISVCQLPLL